MASYYSHLYSHLLGSISEADYRLLQQADYLPWDAIHPEEAIDSRVRSILEEITVIKYHREEGSCGCI
jgi:hypothetical protein|nr:MAG TPA: hypothetical protein [Caudoviricetes sp.]